MPEKSDKTALPGDEVKLKPFLGIRPGVYLACIYGTVLAIILFFVLLHPGLSNPGSVVIVKSEPRGAAVLVDGVYREAAPCKIFVSRGRHEIELRLPGFTPLQIEKEIKSRLFASALFPLKTEISLKLQAARPAEAFVNEAAEYAAWTFAGEPSAAYQAPLSLSEGAYRLGPYAADSEVRESMEDTISASAQFAVTRAALRDLIRAKTLLDNQGLSPSPVSLLGSAEDVIDFLYENPQAALWLGSLLTGEAQSVLTGSAWYEAASAGRHETALSQAASPARGSAPFQGNVFPGSALQSSVQIGGLTFRMIGGGLPLLGANFPAGTTVDTFYISETLISETAWSAFLSNEPKWKKENIDALMKENLAGDAYLEAASGAPGNGVPGISWHAATAFCRWLSSLLPAQFASMEVHLPTEAEWEYAAKAGAFGSPELSGYGSYWEWCEEPFVPLSFLSFSQNGSGTGTAMRFSRFSPERPVRGGSWVNPKGSVTSETRASLPPSFCSPFVSARPVISLKRASQ